MSDRPKPPRRRWLYYLFGDDGVVRYVGASVHPRERLGQHVWEMRRRHGNPCGWKPLDRWLKKELDAGRRIHFLHVRLLDHETWRKDESDEIRWLLSGGAPLLNVFFDGFSWDRDSEFYWVRDEKAAKKRRDRLRSARDRWRKKIYG